MYLITALFLATFAASSVAQQPASVTPSRPAPAPLQVANPHYVSLQLTQDVHAPADRVWARVGEYCDIGKWAFPDCRLLAGDGGYGSERNIMNEVQVGKTGHSYTYTQPVRTNAKYNLYHGTLEVVPVTAKTSQLVYSFFYDNSMLADDAARDAEIATRRKRFTAFLLNMKTLAEGGKVPSSAKEAMPPSLTPDQLQTPNPHYAVIPMTITVNAPVDAVWARVGKYCDIGEWGIPDCKILSGDGGLGTVRSIGHEVLVGKTRYSYTYTQPVREGVTYNMYHGTLEAVPLTDKTTRLNYTLVFDNSMLADDAARSRDIDNRRARFTKMLENMKVLSEGGSLPPEALRGGASAARPASR
ncbi:SRPBCC family protein [Paracidobacterium acidisoli]|nr:SRPBCC family protein [Paracidobacterium acidisoli]MBT9333346.1 SRPBCC family protein [Paracidobacterium acidisoli]